MSIPFSGTFTKSGGLFSAISKQVKLVNLKPVKKVLFKFDPFHDKAAETRLFMFHLTCNKVLQTNLTLKVKTEVVCDRSDPLVVFNLANGDTVEFRSANLKALEMLQMVNKHITSLVPKEDPTADTLATKGTKQASKKISKKKK